MAFPHFLAFKKSSIQFSSAYNNGRKINRLDVLTQEHIFKFHQHREHKVYRYS